MPKEGSAYGQLSAYGLAVLGALGGSFAGLLVKLFKWILELLLDLVWFELPRILDSWGWSSGSPFALYHFTWIWGGLMGAVVGGLRHFLPPESVPTLGLWVRHLHGPRGTAPAGLWVGAVAGLGVVTVLSGAAVGPEPLVVIGPSVLFAAVVERWGHKALPLLAETPAREGEGAQLRQVVRVAALAGGAGGLAAFFGLPLASAFMVLEVPHVDGAEFALEALPACVVASLMGTLLGDCVWHPKQLLGNSRFWFPGSPSLSEESAIHQRAFGLQAVLFAPCAGMVGGCAAHLLIGCIKALHIVLHRFLGPQTRGQLAARRAALLATVGAVNAALGLVYPSALFWGEEQLQVALTRGCDGMAPSCQPVELPHWYVGLQSDFAIRASKGQPMTAWQMVGLGVVKIVMISLCEAAGFVGGTIYPVIFVAACFGSALGSTAMVQSWGGQFVYLSTAAAMSTALAALLNTNLFGILLVLVLQANIPDGNVSSQIIALMTAVYTHYFLTRTTVVPYLHLLVSQKARDDVRYVPYEASSGGSENSDAELSAGDSTDSDSEQMSSL
ncbi:unnamed protein product [Effrenium voratum]|uniref:Chloride channel protein n=1 Tax=Effrenium voratum TaxID=2562239 RepID=A0AA36NN23_9DINO|nr:unnamed protein product [Effrenium voratum]CAJ1442201.1 unnamed protein product [Effrenium voratum]